MLNYAHNLSQSSRSKFIHGDKVLLFTKYFEFIFIKMAYLCVLFTDFTFNTFTREFAPRDFVKFQNKYITQEISLKYRLRFGITRYLLTQSMDWFQAEIQKQR